jgi:DNA polymerase-1
VYQTGRVFDDPLLDQLDLMPALVESFGFVSAQAGGWEADDFLAASAARWPGPVVVASNDRDAFQLVSGRVSILQPVRGGGFARVGIEEVRERYGIEPEQVPDFIALRGDPSDRIPGAPGVGPKSAAALLHEYGTLEGALEAGRFSPIADDLRLYRRVAAMDAEAPLPELRVTRPDWARAEVAARELGLGALARRIAERT